MKNFKVICLFALLMLTSCAGMKENWIATNCNYDAAYEKGNNDRENGAPMSSADYSRNCQDQQKQDALKGYREGYEKARQQEMNANTGTGTSIKIGGTQINIGNNNKKAYYCKIEAFTHTFDGFGPTKLEAMKIAQAQCTKDYNQMHCQSARCILNR